MLSRYILEFAAKTIETNIMTSRRKKGSQAQRKKKEKFDGISETT